MSSTAEATIAIVAAWLVLLSAMWHPGVSAFLAVTALASLGIYKLAARGQ